MKLRHFHLGLNQKDYVYPDPFGSDFAFETRHICHFIQKKLRKLKFETKNFNQFLIYGSKEPRTDTYYLSDNNWVCEVYFDEELYLSLNTSDEKCEFFINMIIKAVNKTAGNIDFPVDLFEESIDEFRKNGYKNTWIEKSRRFKEKNINAKLLCDLNINNFTLRLQISRSNNILYDKEILKDKPDELCYYYQFKDIRLDGDQLIVTNRVDGELMSLSISTVV